MTHSIRRLAIFTLTMVIFALLFAALVERTARDNRRVQLGTEIGCLHPASANCVYAL
ncbi:hypothetical protein NOF55_18850 [Rhizobiaceae bacterium BDR2-2]|uniref:Uncharacterized protein n=1 Tax=Ectorhizobium quercum TaxID=2965071 RepID=A0AAE3N613_9HYPH|nr:hypothetical protein [Ectorhizobium quercum]MCX8999167.1 hypothetical protein [Ectorhizobium quercum]